MVNAARTRLAVEALVSGNSERFGTSDTEAGRCWSHRGSGRAEGELEAVSAVMSAVPGGPGQWEIGKRTKRSRKMETRRRIEKVTLIGTDSSLNPKGGCLIVR